MAKFKITMDGKRPQMDELSKIDEVALKKKNTEVKVKLSRAVLTEMKKTAGIVTGTDDQIIQAYITKTLRDA